MVMSEISNGGDDYDDNESSSDDFPSGHRPQVRSQVTQKTIDTGQNCSGLTFYYTKIK